MTIFISWSKETSRKVAAILRENLELIFDGLTLFYCLDDVSAGEWSPQIIAKLRDSEFGIFCVTRENLDSPWMHFEAGAISAGGRVERKISLLLIGVDSKELKGPYSLYQQRKFNRDGIHKLVEDIYIKIGQPFSKEVFEKRFNAFYRTISAKREWASIVKESNTNRPSEEDVLLKKIVYHIKELVKDKLNTKCIGTFPDIFSDICDCVESSKKQLVICCDYANYGQFTDKKVKTPGRREERSAYDVYREAINNKAQENVRVSMFVYDDDARRKNNAKQIYADVGKCLENYRIRTGKDFTTAEELLDDLDKSQLYYRKEHFGCLEDSDSIGFVSKLMPIFVWISDENQAVFSIPDSDGNATEHGFATTDMILVKALKSVVMRYAEKPGA